MFDYSIVSLSSARTFWHLVKEDPLWLGWNIGAAVSFVVPLMIMTIARLVGGEGEEEQDNNDQDDAYYNNDNNNHWWNRWYNNNNNNNNNQEENNSQDVPWWWFWGQEGGGSPDAARKGSLILAYVWSIGVFVALVVYGNYVFRKQLLVTASRATATTIQRQTAAAVSLGMLQGALVIFWNLAFLTLILIGGLGDAMEMDGPEVEENGGWYGQLGVCVFLTNLCWLVWGGVLLYLLKRRHTTTASEESYHNEDASTSYVRQDIEGPSSTTATDPKKLEMV